MEPTTIFLAISSIAVLSGGFCYMRKLRKNTRLIRDAKKRAAKRLADREESGVDPYQDSYNFHMSNVSVKHHGRELDKKETNIINAIFEDCIGEVKHRPVFLTGKGVNEAASVPLKESAFDELNRDFSHQVSVEFIEDGFVNWHENYAKKEEKVHIDVELAEVSPDFIWPEGYKAKVNA